MYITTETQFVRWKWRILKIVRVFSDLQRVTDTTLEYKYRTSHQSQRRTVKQARQFDCHSHFETCKKIQILVNGEERYECSRYMASRMSDTLNNLTTQLNLMSLRLTKTVDFYGKFQFLGNIKLLAFDITESTIFWIFYIFAHRVQFRTLKFATGARKSNRLFDHLTERLCS